MSYGVSLAAGAASQFHELPATAQDALISRAADLVEAPWDGTRVLPGGDPAFRDAVFGEGRGLLALYVDDAAETIRIYNIVWFG
ncbi:MAG: hypothetical protein ACT4QG_16345 [Sporichthyaceae bacterium]